MLYSLMPKRPKMEILGKTESTLRTRCAALGVLLLITAWSAHAALIFTYLPASTFNSNTATMDAALGVTGYAIENFETTALLSGLSITLSGNLATATYPPLPNLYDVTLDPFATNNEWAGTKVVTNLQGNQIGTSQRWDSITFTYAPRTTSFGIGLSNFQSTNPAAPQFPITNHTLFVNGVAQGTLETLAGSNFTPGLVRNVYIRIDATGGTVINSVGFQNIVSGGSDGLLFDHLAVVATTTPDPSTLLLVSGATLVCAFRRVARNRTQRAGLALR
jgi:hypothetical protein